MHRLSLAVGMLVAMWPSTSLGDSGILGLRLGEASISDVLTRLGPADGAYLAGMDSDHGPRQGDPIVLVFVQEYRLIDAHPSRMLAFFDAENHRLKVFVVRFEEAVASSEIRNRFGDRFQVVRQHLVLDSGGLEGSLQPCNDPAGTFVSWIFEDIGLQAELDDAGAVTALRFVPPLTLRKEFPPCDGGQAEAP